MSAIASMIDSGPVVWRCEFPIGEEHVAHPLGRWKDPIGDRGQPAVMTPRGVESELFVNRPRNGQRPSQGEGGSRAYLAHLSVESVPIPLPPGPITRGHALPLGGEWRVASIGSRRVENHPARLPPVAHEFAHGAGERW
jgi:hypothetical protein